MLILVGGYNGSYRGVSMLILVGGGYNGSYRGVSMLIMVGGIMVATGLAASPERGRGTNPNHDSAKPQNPFVRLSPYP